MRRNVAVLAVITLVGLATACAGITDPSRDGDGTGRCQVTQGSETRCGVDSLPN